jgi:hypothetical protein
MGSGVNLADLPISPFDNALPNAGKEDNHINSDNMMLLLNEPYRERISSGNKEDVESIFGYGDVDWGTVTTAPMDDGSLPFAWAQPPAESFEFNDSVLRRSVGANKNSMQNDQSNLSILSSQSLIAQHCLAPPTLSSFQSDYISSSNASVSLTNDAIVYHK